jgi:hypothetical protein
MVEKNENGMKAVVASVMVEKVRKTQKVVMKKTQKVVMKKTQKVVWKET